MHPSWSTLLLQAINFAVLAWLLHRFLYQPVLRIIDARRERIAAVYQQAARAESQAQERLIDLRRREDGLTNERAKLLETAAVQAQMAAAARHADAEREARLLLESTRENLVREHAEAAAQLQQTAMALAVTIATKLLEDVPDSVKEQGWLERLSQTLASMADAERESLRRQIDPGLPVVVYTAQPLDAGARESWSEALARALGCAPKVEFSVVAALLAGTEVHFPNAVLRLSWRNTLEKMAAEVRGNANPG